MTPRPALTSTTPLLQFQLLGPVEAFADGRRVDLGSAKQRCVLAVLLAEAGRVVHVDQLVDRVWGSAPPSAVRSTLYSYMTRIRTALRRAGTPRISLHHRAGGYVLELDEDLVDMYRFRRLVTDAGVADSDELVGELLCDALALWRGEALSGLSGKWVEATRASLQEERVTAAVRYFGIELDRGHIDEILPGLRELRG